MARKLFSRLAGSIFSKKAAKRVPVASAPVQVETVTSNALQAAKSDTELHDEHITPLTREERTTNFNPVLLKVGNITNHLSPGASLTGDLVLREGGIRVKCNIKGSITQESTGLLIVDQDAVINGTVRAKYLLVLGEINGDLEVDRIVVGASARITGDITYRRSFGSVTGAKIRGRITEVEQTAVIHQMPTPAPASEFSTATFNRAAPTPSPSIHDDEDDVYAVNGKRHKVFPFPAATRDDEMDAAMPEVRYAVR
jgi:cytoskeletal protein CcmA (bactofilin family)